MSPSAVFPSRTHLALLAIVLALALGVAAPLALNVVWPTYKDAMALQQATGRQVLGTVALAVTDAARQARRGQFAGVAAAFGGLLVAQAAWIFWLSGRLNIG